MRKVAPDRGYAWVVLVATVGSNYVCGVLVYFVGVIHVELLNKYRDDVTTTAWAGSLYSSLQMLSAPLATWLVDRYSCRVSVVVGGVFLCVGFTASAFATSVFQLVFTYGLIAGIGLGLTYSPCLMVITFYFDRLRGLASGISVSGGAVGILTGSLLTQTFIDVYSLSGAFLPIAGLGLQTCVFGMLFRPTQYEGRGKRRQESSPEHQNKAPRESCSEPSSPSTLVKLDPVINKDQDKSLRESFGEASNPSTLVKLDSVFNETQTVSSEELDPKQVIGDSGYRTVEDSEKETSESEQSSSGHSIKKASVSAQDSRTVDEEEGGEERMESAELLNETENLSRKTASGTNATSHELEKPPSRKSMLTTFLNSFSGIVSLMKNQAFILHCTSIFFADINMSGVYLHLPEYSRKHGTEPINAAALFVGVGLFSLASRVGSGCLLTSPRVNALILSVGLMALCGLSSCLFPFYSSTYAGQMTFACLFGLSTGGFYTLINVLTVQLVPLHVLPAAYGLLIFVMGIGWVSGPPLAGLIVDNGGTYEHSFLFLGLTMFASAGFDLLAKIIHTRKARQSGVENKGQGH